MTGSRVGRPFTLLAGATLTSTFGDGLRQVAVPLTAVALGASVTQIGLITMAGTLPWLLFGLLAGAFVDRHDRRVVMVASDGARLLLAAVLVVLTAAGRANLVLLGVLVFAMGVGEVLFDCASVALVPTLVDDDRLNAANGWIYALQNAGRTMLGYATGAPLLLLWRALPYLVDALSFLVSALLLSGTGRLRRPAAVPPASGTGRARQPAAGLLSVTGTIRSGLAEMARDRLLIGLTCVATAVNFTFMGEVAVLAPLVLHQLRLPAYLYGMFLVANALGAILGGLLAGRVAALLGEGRMVLAALLVFAVSSALIGVSPALAVATCFLLSGAAVAAYNTVAITLRQRLVPEHLLATVIGATRMFAWGSMPLGAAAYGALAGAWGLPAVYLLGGGLVAAVTLAFVRTFVRASSRVTTPTPARLTS